MTINTLTFDDATLDVVLEALHIAPLSYARAAPVLAEIQRQMQVAAQANADAVTASHQPLPQIGEAVAQ